MKEEERRVAPRRGMPRRDMHRLGSWRRTTFRVLVPAAEDVGADTAAKPCKPGERERR
jgi:hypothetical protein